MSLSRITDTRAFPYGHLAGNRAFRYAPPGNRLAGRLEEAPRRALPDLQPTIEPPSRPKIPPPVSTMPVLAARQFAAALERERSLADRGTRRFSLIVLRTREGGQKGRHEHQALAKLSRQVCERLRSTDLVGRPDKERVEILLTDTEHAGARVVARWVEQIQTMLGLDLELTIYVYPTVTEPSPNDDLDEYSSRPIHSRTPGNGRSTSNGRTQSKARAGAMERVLTSDSRTITNGRAAAHRPNGHALRLLPGRWPTEDLWPRLGVTTPRWKRILDILGSSLALLALSPLFSLIAVAVRLDSRGPVFFRQQRAGRNGRPFTFYKFRSMIADAEKQRAALASQNEKDGPIFKIRKDPRITRVGRLLRRYSLDELPQLWNVLKGDISLVGPRSPTPDEVGKYERWQRRRLDVIGGITCTWQVSGRSEISFRDWMRLDMRYIACRSLWRDLRLLMQTLPAVISGRGAC